MMKVKRIVVDGMPTQCSECLFCETNGKPSSLDGWCWALKTEVTPFHIPRPTACPLEVENECVWGTYTFDELADGDWKYCPSCGKRIRYEEE
jgi:hypothetical protein